MFVFLIIWWPSLCSSVLLVPPFLFSSMFHSHLFLSIFRYFWLRFSIALSHLLGNIHWTDDLEEPRVQIFAGNWIQRGWKKKNESLLWTSQLQTIDSIHSWPKIPQFLRCNIIRWDLRVSEVLIRTSGQLVLS